MAEVNRRDFLSGLGVTVGTALTALPGVLPSVGVAHAQDKPKGNIPDTPFRLGHMTFCTGAAAVLGEPMYKGQLLAAEEINAQGGLLGKRKIEILKADENAGTDANVKELRRLRLSEKIDFCCGITSSGNTPALGPVAEELKVLTIFVDGCTDFLFDKAVPNPHYIFRITNMQSADGVTGAVAAAMTWPRTKRIAHIHPDYSYGRNAFDHFRIVMKKMVPGAETVSEAWPKLGTTDFSSHITKTIVEKYHKRFNEYPIFQAEGGYTATYMLKTAIDKANHLAGGWPEDDAIISVLEGLMMAAPAGYVYIRPDNHQGYKDAITGFSKNVAEYPFPILDPNRIITIPIRNITAPPGWPKGEPTSTYTWIDKTWPQVAMAAEPAKAPGAARPATPAPAKKQ